MKVKELFIALLEQMEKGNGDKEVAVFAIRGGSETYADASEVDIYVNVFNKVVIQATEKGGW